MRFVVVLLIAGALATACGHNHRKQADARSRELVIDVSLADARKAAIEFELAHHAKPKTVVCGYHVGGAPTCSIQLRHGCDTVQLYRRSGRLLARRPNGPIYCIEVATR